MLGGVSTALDEAVVVAVAAAVAVVRNVLYELKSHQKSQREAPSSYPDVGVGQLSHDMVPTESANFATGHFSHTTDPTEAAYLPSVPWRGGRGV